MAPDEVMMTEEAQALPMDEEEILAQLRAAYDAIENGADDEHGAVLLEVAVDEDGEGFLDEEDEPTSEELEEIEEQSDEVIEHALFKSTDDPVRMYLLEIGQVSLLEHHEEVWLSVQRTAGTRVQSLRDEIVEDEDGNLAQKVLGTLLQELREACEEVSRRCDELGVAPPDLAAVAAEAAFLQGNLLPAQSSYIHSFLERNGWTSSQSDTRTALAERLFDVFRVLYTLPRSVLEAVEVAWRREEPIPPREELEAAAGPGDAH